MILVVQDLNQDCMLLLLLRQFIMHSGLLHSSPPLDPHYIMFSPAATGAQVVATRLCVLDESCS